MTSTPSHSRSASAGALDWQGAKRDTQALELRIAQQFPSADVQSVDQQATGTLMQCGEDTWQRTGGTTVTLSSSANPASLLGAAQAYWKGQSGFEVNASKDQDGDPTLQFNRGQNEGYVISVWKNPTQLVISSFSNCFRVPDDVYPRGNY